MVRLVFNDSNKYEICDLIGAMPAPPPIYTISLFVGFIRKSPKGPVKVTLSPGFRLNI